MRMYAVIASALCLTFAGCCKDKLAGSGSESSPETPAVGLSAPPTPEWSDHELKFKEIKAKGSFFVKGLDYTLTFRSFPKGTVIVVGGKEHAVDDGGGAYVKIDLGEKIGAMAPKDAIDYKHKPDPEIPFTIKFPGGIDMPLKAPALAVAFQLKDSLKKITDGPITFGKELEAAPSQHTVLYLGTMSEVIGPAATMAQVDWIAVMEKLPVRAGKMCHGYKDTGKESKGAPRSYPLELQDEEVQVYARRTGKLLQKKTFKASERCPLIASGGKARSYPDSRAIAKWLRDNRK